MDIGRDVNATQLRRFEVEAFEHVEELEKLGATVSVGRHDGRMKFGEHDSMPWNCVYVVVSYKDDVKETVLVPKHAHVSFG